MTISNRKSNPVNFDSKRHFKPASPMLDGQSWRWIEKGGAFEKVTAPCSVLACPIQESPNLFVSRLRNNPDLAEWVKV